MEAHNSWPYIIGFHTYHISLHKVGHHDDDASVAFPYHPPEVNNGAGNGACMPNKRGR